MIDEPNHLPPPDFETVPLPSFPTDQIGGPLSLCPAPDCFVWVPAGDLTTQRDHLTESHPELVAWMGESWDDGPNDG